MEELEILVTFEKEKMETDRIAKLKYQAPFVGMPENEMKYSAWGEPNEIEVPVITRLTTYR